MYFIFLLLTLCQLAYSQCEASNDQNLIAVLMYDQPQYKKLENFFYGEGLTYSIKQSNLNENPQLIQSFTINNGSNMTINSSTIIATSILYYGLNPYIQSNNFSILFLPYGANYYQLGLGYINQQGQFEGHSLSTTILANNYNCLDVIALTEITFYITCYNNETLDLAYFIFDSSVQELTVGAYNQTFTFNNIVDLETQAYFNDSRICTQTLIKSKEFTTLVISYLDKDYQSSVIWEFSGEFIEAYLGLDGTLFSLSKQELLIQNDGQISKFLNLDSDQNFLQFDAQYNYNGLSYYGISIITSEALYSFLINANQSQILTTISSHVKKGDIPIEYQENILKFEVNLKDLILHSNIGILYYRIDNVIKLIDYVKTNQSESFVSIFWNSQLIAFFNQDQFYSIQFGEAQLYFSNELSNQIFDSKGSNLTITATSYNGQQCNQKLFLQTFSHNLCPIPTVVQDIAKTRTVQYPEQVILDLRRYFVGFNLSFSLSTIKDNIDVNQTTFIEINDYIYIGQCQVLDLLFTLRQADDYSSNINIELKGYPIKNQSFAFDAIVLSFHCSVEINLILLSMTFEQGIQIINLDEDQNLQYYGSLEIANFPNSTADTTILNNLISQNVILILTQQPNYIYCYSLKNLTKLEYTITNQQPRNIFENRAVYQNLVFIDNTNELLIIQNSGVQEYQIFNIIQYPITDSIDVAIGLLKDGIFLALKTKVESKLYLYSPNAILPISFNQIMSCQEIKLQGREFDDQIISGFTQNYFYILAHDKLQVYQTFGSPYNSLLYLSPNLSLGQSKWTLSAVTQDILDYCYISSESSMAYEFQIHSEILKRLTISFNNELNYPFTALLLATSTYCENNFQMNFYVKNDQLQITSLQQNQTFDGSKYNNHSLDVQELFNGTIEKIIATCQQCRSFNYTEIINTISTIPEQVMINAVENQNNLYLQSSNGILYQYSNDILLQTLVQCTAKYCHFFTELLSQELIAVYGDDVETVFQITSMPKSNLTYSACSKYLFYQNGILQLLDDYTQVLLYFWVQNNEITIETINKITYELPFVNPAPLNISMGENLGSQSYQYFGIISAQGPTIFQCFICTPQKILTIFGSQTQCTQSNYFVHSTLNLLEQIIQSQTITSIFQQIGYPLLVNGNYDLQILFDAQMYTLSVNNATFGNLRTICSLYYINDDNSYFLSNQELIVNSNIINGSTFLQIEVFNFDKCVNKSQLPFISAYNLPLTSTFVGQNAFLTQNYVISSLIQTDSNVTFVAKVQSTLDLNYELYEPTNIIVQAVNSAFESSIEAQFKYVIFVRSEGFIFGVIVIIVFIIVIVAALCRIRYREKQKEKKLKEQQEKENNSEQGIEIKTQLISKEQQQEIEEEEQEK